MRITPDVLQCVVFLCREREVEGQRQTLPTATGFLVSMQGAPGSFFHYLVTCRHAIESDRTGRLIVRANTKDGRSVYIPTEASEWMVHDRADVALLPFSVTDDLELRSIHYPSHMVARSGQPANYSFTTVFQEGGKPIGQSVDYISTGDEVAVIGLFVENYGDAKNLPIARMGHVARMPSEVNTPRWRGDRFKSAAYLAEFFAYPGLSGSPVFWFSTIEVNEPCAGNFRRATRTLIPALIGCVNGYVPRPERADVVGDVLGQITTNINTGIATVTPAYAILELLEHRELVAQREKATQAASEPRNYVSLAIAKEKVHAIHEPWYYPKAPQPRHDPEPSLERSEDGPPPTEGGPRLGGAATL